MKTIFQALFLLCMVQYATAQAPYTLPKLPYAFDALEPSIDAKTMEIHHGRHHQGYVTNLNKALEGTDATTLPLEELMRNISKYAAAVRNNGGGHYNHTLFWECLTPTMGTQVSPALSEAIVRDFGSMEEMVKLMNTEAGKRFGSGWVWLVVTPDNKLVVTSTPNQDNPLMDIAEVRGTPILGIDVWEHAYYLNYQNRRGDYMTAIWKVINWDAVSEKFTKVPKKGLFDDWPAIKDFHKVMSQTFHPSEEGDLAPIRARSGEMFAKATALTTAPIPAEFDRPEIKKSIADLVKGSRKLDKQVRKDASDADLTASLNALHDVFHTIVGLCRD